MCRHANWDMPSSCFIPLLCEQSDWWKVFLIIHEVPSPKVSNPVPLDLRCNESEHFFLKLRLHSKNSSTSEKLLLVLIHCINENMTAACCVIWCSRVAELTEQLHSTEDKGRVEREALLDRLHGLTTESTAAKLENQSLKVKHPNSPQKAVIHLTVRTHWLNVNLTLPWSESLHICYLFVVQIMSFLSPYFILIDLHWLILH